MSSPLNYLRYYEAVFKFYGAFEIETDSKFLKRFMMCHKFGYQLTFTYLGCILFTLSLFESSSSKETHQILFVVFAYLNVVFKMMIFFKNRKKLESLWSSLCDLDFVAKDSIEEK